MKLKEALTYRPGYMCPFCEWTAPYRTFFPIMAWKKHIREGECYKELDKTTQNDN